MKMVMPDFGSRRTTLGMSPSEAAAHWLVRLDAGSLESTEQAAFDDWFAATPANTEAFARAKRAWHLFDAGEDDAHLKALRLSALKAEPERRRGIWMGLGASVAASLLALAVLGSEYLSHQPAQAPAVVTKASASGGSATVAEQASAALDQGAYATARGERRTLKLGDGSTVTLNTDSAIGVAYGPDRRLIRLVRGQALFEVAKNKARPFVVRAGDREVTALGTVFEVRLDPGRIKVTLVEGRVVVDGIEGAHRPGPVIVPVVLRPGQELVAQMGTLQKVTGVDLDEQLRWRDGYVEFEDVPLSRAIVEINRYTKRPLVVANARTGALRVSGLFRTGDPERFASIVGELLPVRSRTLPGGRIELFMPPPHAPGG